MAIFRATPLVLSLAAAWPALAATPAELETVQVTAHRSSKPLAETAPNASVISRHKLDDQLVRDIADEFTPPAGAPATPPPEDERIARLEQSLVSVLALLDNALHSRPGALGERP